MFLSFLFYRAAENLPPHGFYYLTSANAGGMDLLEIAQVYQRSGPVSYTHLIYKD